MSLETRIRARAEVQPNFDPPLQLNGPGHALVDELARIASRFAFEDLQRQLLIDVRVPAMRCDGDE